MLSEWLRKEEDRITGEEELKEVRGQSVHKVIYVGVEITDLKIGSGWVTRSHSFFKK